MAATACNIWLIQEAIITSPMVIAYHVKYNAQDTLEH